jgi:hypothetical protein
MRQQQSDSWKIPAIPPITTFDKGLRSSSSYWFDLPLSSLVSIPCPQIPLLEQDLTSECVNLSLYLNFSIMGRKFRGILSSSLTVLTIARRPKTQNCQDCKNIAVIMDSKTIQSFYLKSFILFFSTTKV